MNTGATYSVLNVKLEEIDPGKVVNFIGATGQQQKVSFLKSLSYKLGKTVGIHRFLYMATVPKPLIGRDLLEKLQAKIKFTPEGVQIKVNDEELINVLSLVML